MSASSPLTSVPLGPTEAEAWFADRFARNVGIGEHDFISEDLHTVLVVKPQLGAVRDLHAAAAQLAIASTNLSDIHRAVLVVFDSAVSPSRVRAEWVRVREVMQPQIAKKLFLVVGGPESAFSSENLDDLAPLVSWAHARENKRKTAVDTPRNGGPTPKFFEVWKVLFASWLQNEGPLAVRVLEARAGAAYPTVADTLRLLAQRNELSRGKGRSVQLARWPHETLSKLVPLLRELRRTVWFGDKTGRGIDPAWLLKRARKLAPAGVALGGVEGARVLDPSFDLVGLPRLDLTLHVASGDGLAWVEKLDPALGRVEGEPGAALALHMLGRADPLFSLRAGELPLADPAEVVLDVTELRLGEQRDALVRTLREGAPQ